jgi:DNA modification methylase
MTEQNHRITLKPCSVVDIEAQTDNNKRRGKGEFHDSSRKQMSHHPKETALMAYELYLRDANHVFDPFGGFGERGYYAKECGVAYTGYDISQPNIDAAKEAYGVENELKDSLLDNPPEFFDGVYTCPPYWNLEKYDGDNDGAGDKIKKWDDFIEWYGELWAHIYDFAPSGTKFVIQVGDWRKNHVYYDLEFETQRIFKDLGAKVFDKVILNRSKVSKIKVMAPQALRLGYTVKVHETLLVFVKP